MVEPANKRCGLEYLVLSRLLDKPAELCTVARDRQRGAGMRAPDAGERGDRVVYALLVLEPSQVHQLRGTGSELTTREGPQRCVDSVANDAGLDQAGPEQLRDLIAHRGRTGYERIGFVHEPRFDRVHLSADPTRNPARMPAGLSGVDGGNQWDIEVFGESDGGMRNQPVVSVHDVGSPRSVAVTLDSQPGADHRMPHRQRPRHHVGAEVELM